MSEVKISFSETEKVEESHERKKKKHKKKHHHHHKRSLSVISFDVQGVVHVVISPEVQAALQCVVGEHVTAEKPWKKIQKHLLLENLETEEISLEYLPFFKYKEEIVSYPDEEMMIGYIPDEGRDYDEFYFCITPQGFEQVLNIIKKAEEGQQKRLNNRINKDVRTWETFGSEREVEENMPTRSRSLYKIEYETKYPIMIPNVKLGIRLVENARDGYMELLVPSRITISTVGRKRVDTEVQAASLVVDSEVQMSSDIPKNRWTQYNYVYDPVIGSNKEFVKSFKEFIDSSIEGVTDKLFVNSKINFFADDYLNLIVNQTEQHKVFIQREYMSFKDVEKCKDKMISAVDWHCLWTGVVAIAYANLSPRWYLKYSGLTAAEEYVEEAVFGFNPVLIWSFSDGLSPKLLLETPSEVHCLAFCRHNPNILIGGCINGSVVVWDIRNKIENVEHEEILTTDQNKYRTLMFSMMKWMKNTKNIAVVPITVISDLQYTHFNNVTSICWIHPNYHFSQTGHFEEIDDPENNYSLQFVTSSSDGSIKFWDLKQKPISLPGDYKPQRKSRRLKKRPSALTLDVSPFRILNRKFRPHYQINVVLPKQTVACPIGVICIDYNLKYIEADSNLNKGPSFSERIHYKPIFENLPDFPRTEFAAGSYMGDFIFGSWEGFDFLSGDVVSKETCKIVNLGKYHDGPVLQVCKHPLISKVHLSVGGKVFAIWHENLKGKPVFWRRSQHKYTHGAWSNRPSGIRLNRSDGNREIWDLECRSDTFYIENAYSGKALLDGVMHPLPWKESVVGLADENGTFRLIFVKRLRFDLVDNVEFADMLINCNAQRKLEFIKWQENWTNRHASWIKQQQEEALAEQQRKREEEIFQKQLEEEQKAQEAIEAAKKNAAKLRPPPGQYNEWAQEQWIIKEQERMGNTLLKMKRLDKDTLVAQQAPLKKLEAENENKLLKQKEKLQKAEDIFQETISMLFPDVIGVVKKVGDSDLYLSNEDITEAKNGYYNAYKEAVDESLEFIKETSFSYDFNWIEMVRSSLNKKKKNDPQTAKSHRARRIKTSERDSLLLSSSNSSDKNDDSTYDIEEENKLQKKKSSFASGSTPRVSIVRFLD